MSNDIEVYQPDYGPEPLTENKAKALDKKIRAASDKVDTNFHALIDLLEEAAEGLIHVALGYSSWPAYVKDAVQFSVMDRIERKSLVALMTGKGMSQRAIAAALGTSKGTVQNDQKVDNTCPPDNVTGLDGKTYPKPRPTPEPKQLDAESQDEQQVWEEEPEPEPEPPWVPTPLTQVFDDEMFQLENDVQAIQEILADERFTNARNRIARKNLDRLQAAIAELHAVADVLTTN